MCQQESKLLSCAFFRDLNFQEAYASVVRNVSDILDTTPAGTSLWASAQQQYEKQVERIESKMTRLLEERLTAAASADEMFRVFSTFNPLFFRPAIKNAVNSFRYVDVHVCGYLTGFVVAVVVSRIHLGLRLC